MIELVKKKILLGFMTIVFAMVSLPLVSVRSEFIPVQVGLNSSNTNTSTIVYIERGNFA